MRGWLLLWKNDRRSGRISSLDMAASKAEINKRDEA
jgi:hypothetical protein